MILKIIDGGVIKKLVLLFLIGSILGSCRSTYKINEIGFKSLQKKNYKKANKLFDKVLKKDVFNKDANYGLGISAYEVRRYDNAVYYFNSAISMGKTSAKKDRGLAHYEIAHKYYSQRLYKEGVISINKSISDFPSLEKALKLKPHILIGDIKSDLTNGLPKKIRNKYILLLEQKKKYLAPISEEILFLDPKLRLFMAEYNLSIGNAKTALSDVQKIIKQNNKYVNPYRSDAISLRSKIYEFKSKKEFNLKNYEEALTYIQRAISDSPNNNKLFYHRAKIYEKIAGYFFRKDNDLKRALEYANLASKEGNYNTKKSSLKLRAQIYFAVAINESNMDSQIKYCELALEDDAHNREIKSYIYNLYLSFVAKLIDEDNLYKAREVFKKAIEIDNTHLSTYNMFDRNINKKGDIYLDASIAEIYVINLRYQDAIGILNIHKYDTSSYKTNLYYDLARYYALNNNKYSAIDILSDFFTKSSLRTSYNFYREKAKKDPSFLSLKYNNSFLKWLNGINRIKLSLNYIQDVPKVDIWSKSDPYLAISQSKRLLLTTPKAQDQSNVFWSKELFHVVFDYDYDNPLIFMLADSDTTTDTLIFYNSFDDFYPNNWNITLYNEKYGTAKLDIDIENCNSCPNEYSTYTELPPKNAFLASLENSLIRQNLDPIETIYVPKIAEDYGHVNQSYYFISNVINNLAPCFATYIVALSKKGFVTKQIYYWLFQSFDEIDYNKFTFEAFVEYMLNKVGNHFLQNANNFRVFCDCAYNKIKT